VPYPIQSVSDVHEPPRGVPEDGAVVEEEPYKDDPDEEAPDKDDPDEEEPDKDDPDEEEPYKDDPDEDPVVEIFEIATTVIIIIVITNNVILPIA